MGIKEHKLKTWPAFYKYVDSGEKTFEIRKDDRDFEVGDTLVLQEYAFGKLTGKECRRKITFIITMYPLFDDNYVGMSIKPIEDEEKGDSA